MPNELHVYNTREAIESKDLFSCALANFTFAEGILFGCKCRRV
jgi:hypothetical protein